MDKSFIYGQNNGVAASAKDNKFFFTPETVIEYATYQRIMSSDIRTNSGKTAWYMNLCQYMENNEMGVYQMSFCVDTTIPRERRTVYCAVNKLPAHMYKGSIAFGPGGKYPPVCSSNVNIKDWDSVRDIVINAMYDCLDKIVYGRDRECEMSLTA